MSKVPSTFLREVGLKLMARAGKPLERIKDSGSAKVYALPDGRTVRLRTSNDRVLIAAAASPEENSRLDIAGTDYLLVVMPETVRMPGPAVAYLVPTCVAIRAIHTAHSEWIASSPDTKGNNRTWNIWFDKGGPESCNDFAEKWENYRLPGSADTQ